MDVKIGFGTIKLNKEQMKKQVIEAVQELVKEGTESGYMALPKDKHPIKDFLNDIKEVLKDYEILEDNDSLYAILSKDGKHNLLKGLEGYEEKLLEELAEVRYTAKKFRG